MRALLVLRGKQFMWREVFPNARPTSIERKCMMHVHCASGTIERYTSL